MTKVTIKLNITNSKKEPEQKQFAKIDEDQRMVFGFFSVVEENGQPVVDYHGDVIAPDDMEKAAYQYVINSRMGDERHDERPKAVLVESIFLSHEKQSALGIDLKKVAWWGGFKINDDELWQKVKSGQYSMFSIGGRSQIEKP